MLQFIKKQRVAFYASVVAVVMAIVAMSVYGVNSNAQYYVVSGSGGVSGAVIALSILAVILIAARVVLCEIADDKRLKYLSDLMILVACVFVAASFMTFVSERVYDIAIVMFSDLEAGNEVATTAVSQSITGFVLYGITLAFAVVAAFFSVKKKD